MKYIKNKILSQLLYAFVLLIGTGLFVSCSNDDNEAIDPNKGAGLVTFAVKVPGQSLPSTYALTDGQEMEIKTIDVLIFDENSKYTDILLSPEKLTKQGNDVMFTVKIPEGRNYQINVFANARDVIYDQRAYFKKGDSKESVLSALTLTLTHTGKWNTDMLLPMWGEIPSLTVSSTTPTRNTVNLARMLAKVKVIAHGGTQIGNIAIYNQHDSGFVVPTPANWDATANKAKKASPMGSKNGTIYYYDSENNQSKNEIFLFESDNANSTLDKRDRTCVIIEALYNNEWYYYRLDFMNTSNGYIDILRNHSYTFNIRSIGKAGTKNIEEAIRSEPINMEGGGANLDIIDDERIGYAVFDDNNFLGVTNKEMVFQANSFNNNDGDLWITTDVSSGYTITNVRGGAGWLSVERLHEGQPTTIASGLVMQANGTGQDRVAYIDIEAGQLKLTVKITQLTSMAS